MDVYFQHLRYIVAMVIAMLVYIDAQTIAPPLRNVTASGGDDVYLSCPQSAGDPLVVLWQKEGVSVEATDTYRDGRIYKTENSGMLILNTELWDRGLYSCMVIRDDGNMMTSQTWLDIAPPADADVHSGSAFQCGYPRVRGKVVGGKVSSEGQSPWTALLWNTVQNKPLCGAVLLNRRWIVTAAHCFSDTQVSKEQFEVRLGEHDTQTVDSNERHFRPEQIIQHPNFNAETYDSDIALVKLVQPVTYTDYIIPICLPSELRAEELIQEGTRGIVTGWGNTDEGSDYSRVLRKVRLTVTSQQDCGNRHEDIITNNMFCAGAGGKTSRRDACQGDSGGPFVTKDNNRWYLLGIVSWGIGCARPEFPGVYTRVHRFRQWITDLVQQDMQTCEESSFELGEDLQASRKETYNLRLLNQNQHNQIELQHSQIEALREELMRKESEVFDLQERLYSENCSSVSTSSPTSPQMPTSSPEPTTTEPRPLTTRAPMPEEPIPCRQNMCWHVGLWARCHGGFCTCNPPDFSPVSCLPTVGTCHIYRNNSYALARPSFRGDRRTADTYACEGSSDTNIHVISLYEGPVHTRPPTAGDVTVRITGGDQGPLVLFFGSYEPVHWLLDIDDGIVVERIYLTAYYLDLSSVEIRGGSPQNVSVTTLSRVPFGYGPNSASSNTVALLKYVRNNIGEVASFTGTYRADDWVLTLPGESTEPVYIGHLLPMPRVESSISHSRWTQFAFTFDNSWCACSGEQYVKMVGADSTVNFGAAYVGVVLCTSQRYKIFLGNDLYGVFLNIGDSHGSGHDHCEFVGALPENEALTSTADDRFFYIPVVQGYYRGTWGESVQMGTIGGSHQDWTPNMMVGWYECGLTIP